MGAVPVKTAVCRLCAGPVDRVRSMKVLGRHEVGLHQCRMCRFIQTDTPWWLDEAYSSAITATDVGLVARCTALSGRIPSVLACAPRRGSSVLDWGGGYGLLTRMLRDRGIDCWHWDPHCVNIHAPHHGADVTDRERWGAILAVEVLEHLVDPWQFFRPAALKADLLVVTTCLAPEGPIPGKDWWYWAPEHGQHVSFYTRRSMEHVADEIGMVYTPAGQMHVFSRGIGTARRLAMRISPVRRVIERMRRTRSLLRADYREAVNRASGLETGPD